MNEQKGQFLNIPYSILSDKGFSLPEKAVYSYLKGWDKAFPGVSKIASVIGIGESTVKEITKKLVKAGKLTKHRRFGNSNIYVCADWHSSEQPESRHSQEDESTNSQNPDHEQPESGSLLAGIQTMNSQNPDTIRIGIKSSITSELLNQLKEVTEELQDDIPNSNISSTVYSLPTVSSLSVVEFSDSSQAFQHVQSMGSQVTKQEFTYHFGSIGKYEEPELNIRIKRVYA